MIRKILYLGPNNHKRYIGDFLVSPVIDSLVLNDKVNKIVVLTFGEIKGKELVQSQTISQRISFLNFFRYQFICGLPNLDDIQFIFNLFRPNNHPSLIKPVNDRLWILYAVRAYFIARYFSVVFHEYAQRNDEGRVLVYYGSRMLGFVMAFRRLSKPVFDLQHGYIGFSHNAYNRKELFNSNSLFVPTGIIFWSENFYRDNPSLVRLESIFTDYLHLKMFSTENTTKETPCYILISLQWGTALPGFIEELIMNENKFSWKLRYHPLENKSRKDIEKLSKFSNVIISGHANSLSSDLVNAALHVTVNSSTVHEAARLGVVSLITDYSTISRFQREINDGLAFYVDDSNFRKLVTRFSSGLVKSKQGET